MNSPNTGNPMREVETEPHTYTLRGEEFNVQTSPSWECPDTNERYSTPEQVDMSLLCIYAAWRERQGISKEVIQKRTMELGLSDSEAAESLGIALKKFRAFKNTDKLPSKLKARLLQIFCDERATALFSKQNKMTPEEHYLKNGEWDNVEFHCRICSPAMETLTVVCDYAPKTQNKTYSCLNCNGSRTVEASHDWFIYGDIIDMDW